MNFREPFDHGLYNSFPTVRSITSPAAPRKQTWGYLYCEVQSPISVGPACRAGLRGHAATSDASPSKGRPSGDVERMCHPWQFALRPSENPFRQKGPPLTIIRECTVDGGGHKEMRPLAARTSCVEPDHAMGQHLKTEAEGVRHELTTRNVSSKMSRRIRSLTPHCTGKDST
jgi:hypothetical protein